MMYSTLFCSVPDDIPSVSGAANQINILLQRHDLDTVFLATDAPSKGEYIMCMYVHTLWLGIDSQLCYKNKLAYPFKSAELFLCLCVRNDCLLSLNL